MDLTQLPDLLDEKDCCPSSTKWKIEQEIIDEFLSEFDPDTFPVDNNHEKYHNGNIRAYLLRDGAFHLVFAHNELDRLPLLTEARSKIQDLRTGNWAYFLLYTGAIRLFINEYKDGRCEVNIQNETYPSKEQIHFINCVINHYLSNIDTVHAVIESWRIQERLINMKKYEWEGEVTSVNDFPRSFFSPCRK